MLDEFKIHLEDGPVWLKIPQIINDTKGVPYTNYLERKEYTVFNLGEKEYKLKGNFIMELKNMSEMENPEMKIIEFYESIIEYHA